MMCPRVRLHVGASGLSVRRAVLKRLASAALHRIVRLRPVGAPARPVAPGPVTVGLVVLDDPAIRRLNRRFLGHDCATDVIAFNLQPGTRDSGPAAPWGEVYVSATTARREAKARGIDPAEELLRYAIHGMLHLFGYDDHRPADRRRMWARQEALVREAQNTETRRTRRRRGGAV